MLYIASITQARDDPAAQAFLDRKTTEGKTRREARRAHNATLTDLGLEANIATWLSVVLLALLVALLGLRAAISRERTGWLVLAIATLALSVDEGSKLHERIAGFAGERVRVPGVDLAFNWVVPGAIAAFGLLGVLRHRPCALQRR